MKSSFNTQNRCPSALMIEMFAESENLWWKHLKPASCKEKNQFVEVTIIVAIANVQTKHLTHHGPVWAEIVCTHFRLHILRFCTGRVGALRQSGVFLLAAARRSPAV